MTYIFYTYFQSKLDSALFEDYLNRLPYKIQHKIKRFIRWQDQQASLFGKLLLAKSFKHINNNNINLNDLLYSASGRPYFNNSIDFNISHSGGYVICAITKKGRLGIDVEKIRNIKIFDFKRYMNTDEWESINNSSHPEKAFFSYWTLKESVMKANGKGMSIPLKDVIIKNNKAHLYNTLWYLNEINISNDCKCHLAISYEEYNLNINNIEPDNF